MTTYTLTTDPANRASVMGALVSEIASLDTDRRYTVEIREETRSGAQNRYIWAVVYRTIVEWMRDHHGRDYSDEAIHETLKTLFLPSRTEQMARGEVRIYRSTTKLTKQEFGEYVDHCIRWAAEFGCVIPPSDIDYHHAAESGTTEKRAA